jgi:hypothetical protein
MTCPRRRDEGPLLRPGGYRIALFGQRGASRSVRDASDLATSLDANTTHH